MSLQEEYLSEGIKWQSVGYTDNYECLELIAGKPVGLLSLLDEECRCLSVCMSVGLCEYVLHVCVLVCVCVSVCMFCMYVCVC